MTDHYTDDGHDYVSTDCWHAQHDQCRLTCTYCGATCRCGCHVEHEPGSFGDLIEQSSFGGPEAMAMRARTPTSAVDDLLDRMRADRMAATRADVEALVETMRHEYTPEARRLHATHELLDDFEARVKELAYVRRTLIADLLEAGWARVEVAAMLGVTRSRISQLMQKDDPN